MHVCVFPDTSFFRPFSLWKHGRLSKGRNIAENTRNTSLFIMQNGEENECVMFDLQRSKTHARVIEDWLGHVVTKGQRERKSCSEAFTWKDPRHTSYVRLMGFVIAHRKVKHGCLNRESSFESLPGMTKKQESYTGFWGSTERWLHGVTETENVVLMLYQERLKAQVLPWVPKLHGKVTPHGYRKRESSCHALPGRIKHASLTWIWEALWLSMGRWRHKVPGRHLNFLPGNGKDTSFTWTWL